MNRLNFSSTNCTLLLSTESNIYTESRWWNDEHYVIATSRAHNLKHHNEHLTPTVRADSPSTRTVRADSPTTRTGHVDSPTYAYWHSISMYTYMYVYIVALLLDTQQAISTTTTSEDMTR